MILKFLSLRLYSLWVSSPILQQFLQITSRRIHVKNVSEMLNEYITPFYEFLGFYRTRRWRHSNIQKPPRRFLFFILTYPSNRLGFFISNVSVHFSRDCTFLVFITIFWSCIYSRRIFPTVLNIYIISPTSSFLIQ